MKRLLVQYVVLMYVACLFSMNAKAQKKDTANDSTKFYKNVVRYNLSGGLFFGFDKHIVLGYERIINRHQSISINGGKVAFPRLVSIVTDSLSFDKENKNTGVNISIDYRFYLAKENRYRPPHGLYIGPYYSFNRFKRENEFTFKRQGGVSQTGTSNTTFTINTIGGELGYQFILWKRLALDFVLIGPGLSSYDISAKFDGNLSEKDRQQLREVVQQVLTQRFPGMNYVLGDKELNANGTLSTWSVGFRYLIHIGFVF